MNPNATQFITPFTISLDSRALWQDEYEHWYHEIVVLMHAM
jgi:hypothetical protein